MKKRILLATALSFFIHLLLLGLNWGFLNDRRVIIPKSRNMTITMYYKEPGLPAGPPRTEKMKIRKPDIKPRKETDKKEIMQPAEAEKIAVEPVPSEPEAEEAEKLEQEIPDNTIFGTESTAGDESGTADTISGTESTAGDESGTADTISGTEGTAGDESATAFIKEAIPQYRNNPLPVYPKVARRRGHQGTVLLEVLVDRNGGVRDLRVFRSSGHTTLDDAALASVKNWLFDPGMRGSRPVEMWIRLPVRFQLK